MERDRWEPTPVPQGDGRHDIGDDVRAAIVHRLIDDWSRDPDLTPEKARQLAMWAGASVRALLHELGTLRDLASEDDLMPAAEALMLDGPASGAPDAVDVRSTESTPSESTGASPDFGLLTRRLIQRVVAEMPYYASTPLDDDIKAMLRQAWDADKRPIWDDHSRALEFLRELTKPPCEWGCSSEPEKQPCLRCRAATWLHST